MKRKDLHERDIHDSSNYEESGFWMVTSDFYTDPEPVIVLVNNELDSVWIIQDEDYELIKREVIKEYEIERAMKEEPVIFPVPKENDLVSQDFILKFTKELLKNK
jgi:DNA-binding helix-hairpin-helix protein with protein kinase domain